MTAERPPVCDYEGSDYQTSFWEQGGREYEDRVEQLALQRLLPASGDLLLELGAGAGRNTLRYHGFERIVLLDYSRTQLEQAGERLGDSPRYVYVAADIYCLPFVPGLFDAVKRLGYLRAIFIASLLAVASIIIGILTSFSLFLPLTGFFFSIIFPTLTASISDAEHENINTILGMLFTFSGLGGVIGPWLMAWGSEFFGLQVGFSISILFAALTSVFVFILNERSQHG